jgi:hypothetical protein
MGSCHSQRETFYTDPSTIAVLEGVLSTLKNESFYLVKDTVQFALLLDKVNRVLDATLSLGPSQEANDTDDSSLETTRLNAIKWLAIVHGEQPTTAVVFEAAS